SRWPIGVTLSANTAVTRRPPTMLPITMPTPAGRSRHTPPSGRRSSELAATPRSVQDAPLLQPSQQLRVPTGSPHTRSRRRGTTACANERGHNSFHVVGDIAIDTADFDGS